MDWMGDPAKQRLLDEFLVGNPDLEALDARLSKFNLFRVLRVENAEIRHSNVLAWLLDPAETHGLGNLFLRRFLASAMMEIDAIKGVTLTAAQIELMQLGEVDVYRERHHIDILVRCAARHPSSPSWCLLIENKIHSKESAGQLAKYRSTVEQEFAGDQVIPILLTLDGDDPSEEGEAAGFVPISHLKVLDVASSVIDQHRSRIPSDALIFLEHYLSSLKRLTMQDQDIIDLCKRIYRRHREAIDLIIEHGTSSEVYDNCAETIARLVDSSFAPVVSRKRIWFVPKEVAIVVPPVDMAGWKWLPHATPVCFWLRYSRSNMRAQITLEVGPVADKAIRHRILKEAEAHGIPVKEKQFETAKYARLITESMALKENAETGEAEQSADYIQEVCKTLWQKTWSKAKPIVPALQAAFSK